MARTSAIEQVVGSAFVQHLLQNLHSPILPNHLLYPIPGIESGMRGGTNIGQSDVVALVLHFFYHPEMSDTI